MNSTQSRLLPSHICVRRSHNSYLLYSFMNPSVFIQLLLLLRVTSLITAHVDAASSFDIMEDCGSVVRRKSRRDCPLAMRRVKEQQQFAVTRRRALFRILPKLLTHRSQGYTIRYHIWPAIAYAFVCLSSYPETDFHKRPSQAFLRNRMKWWFGISLSVATIGPPCDPKGSSFANWKSNAIITLAWSFVIDGLFVLIFLPPIDP
eukprot:GHVQ01033543.1.p1 GENE.GHVQ01033543.1~~GHVQ01033543.1.p1  ORF type:complete len:204 (+),score=21.39 GHVQ01033543.1:162-773(+)